MESQTSKRVDLYARGVPPGSPLPINVTPIKIDNDTSSNSKLQGIVGKLTKGQAAGASGMRAEHIKEWLQGVQREGDLEGQGAEGAGDSWCLFIRLVQAA